MSVENPERPQGRGQWQAVLPRVELREAGWAWRPATVAPTRSAARVPRGTSGMTPVSLPSGGRRLATPATRTTFAEYAWLVSDTLPLRGIRRRSGERAPLRRPQTGAFVASSMHGGRAGEHPRIDQPQSMLRRDALRVASGPAAYHEGMKCRTAHTLQPSRHRQRP